LIDPATFTEGQEFKVRGKRGSFIFKGINADGSVCCYGGASGRGLWRNFHADQITKVIRKKPPRE